MKYEIDGVFYNVVLQKKKIRNLYIRYKDGIIYINGPFIMMERDITKILDENIKSMRRMIKRDIKRNNSLFLGQEVDIVGISNLKHPELINNKLYVKDRHKLDEA
jgi:hypothetical protein